MKPHASKTRQTKERKKPGYYQRGIVIVVVTIGMVALLGVAGLALDTGHLLLNKTRLQNAVDAAALNAARTLQLSAGTSAEAMDQARSAAQQAFTDNLSSELNRTGPTPEVTFSETLNPGSFAPAVANPNYVKVASTTIPLDSFLIRAVGFDSKAASAVAVSGPISALGTCDSLPITVCDADPDAGYPEYTENQIYKMKLGAGDGGGSSDVGSGNFHFINDGSSSSGSEVRTKLAGGGFCSNYGDSAPVDLTPGNKVGPAIQGVNTRFGDYSGPMNSAKDDYPPDWANVEGPSRYTMSEASLNVGDDASSLYTSYRSAYPVSAGAIPGTYREYARMVTIPVIDCAGGTLNGATEGEFRHYACFWLVEPSATGGNSSGEILGAFVDDAACDPVGRGISNLNTGLERIVLFKNPDGADS